MKSIDTAVLRHLLSKKSAALIMHENPDWDCLGSSLALRDVLRGEGVVCDVFADEPLSPYLSCFETGVKVYGGETGYECLCSVDVSQASRMGRIGELFKAWDDTACIDHHMSCGGEAKISYVDEKAPATAEIVFDMVKSAGLSFSKRAAEYLYMALSSDTGSFKYAGVTSHTMNVAGELLDMGINAPALCDLLYGRKTLKQLKLQGEVIAALELYREGKIGISYVDKETYEKYSATKNDTEALSNVPKEIDGVVMSAFLTWRGEGVIRVSLRSKGDYNVQKAAAAFGGGGHMRASGCTIEGETMENAVRLVEAELEKQL